MCLCARMVCVCVCVCGTSTAAAGAFTNVKRLSVFVSSGAQLMRAKLKIHCTVSVCVERAQKEETKIESGGRVGSAKAQTLPPLLLLFLSLSPCLSVSVSLSFLGCPNEMWASCRTMKRGSRGCFFTVPEPQCASFNLMFQCKLFFHKLPSPHVCNMAGFTLQPPRHYGYGGKPKCTVAKATFLLPVYLTTFTMITLHVAPVKGAMVNENSAFHTCAFIFQDRGFFLFFFYECKALSLNPAGCSRDSLEQKERDDDDDDTSSLKNNISGLYCFYSPMGKDQSRPTLILLPNGISVA